jgi:hypothetical protein
LPPSGRLTMAIMELHDLITPIEALLIFSDEEDDGAGEDQAVVTLAGGRDEGLLRTSEAPVEPVSENTIVEPKGKEREVGPAMQVDNEAGMGAAVQKPEFVIVVKRGKAHEKEPEPEDLKEYTEQGEPLVLNDPAVSFMLLIIC